LAARIILVRRFLDAGAFVTRINQIKWNLAVEIELTMEREILLNAILVCRMNPGSSCQRAAAFRIFGLQQVPFASPRSQDFSAGSDFKPLGN
jgi:hypothetical protein